MATDDGSSPSGSLSARESQKIKRRRLHGACDGCRRKKSDSAKMPQNQCSNCLAVNGQCTHEIPRQPKKKETQQAYIQSLEERLERLEHFIQTAHPDKDIDQLIEGPMEHYRDIPPLESYSSGNLSELKYTLPHSISGSNDQPETSKSTIVTVKDDPSEADDLAHIALAEHLSHLSIDTLERFFGQSSAFMFAKDAATIKSEMTGISNKLTGGNFRRPVFWDMRPWEREAAMSQTLSYVYPEDDLLRSLVSIYFEKANHFLPVLHRPTFEKSLSLGQHLWDSSFGMTVLLVCALASRYSQDPRVLVDGDDSCLSSGWRYFVQVPIHRNALLYSSTIYDLQYYCLAIIYLIGTSIPNAAWNILGLGIRYAIEKGAHRRKGTSEKPNAEEELLKRAFWSLVCIDRLMSSFLGRPCIIQDEDFDVDYPVECDDEYWYPDDPDQAFKQPPGKPSTITAFICHLRLCDILAYTLRTLYSTKKSKILTGLIGNEWEHRIVAELDSSMNKWKDSLPSFLTWDPERRDAVFFHLSAGLHSTYHYVQIQIHRPFLTKQSDQSFPSLAMCTNAARSCSHLLEATLARGLRVFPNILMAAFASGLVMLLNVWGNNRSGLLDTTKEMANIQICINVLKESERR
ncbi:fungal-specific transcription factor domain-containing protein [Crassisporium funariophilum]|nr:fungal-specific transcription factor domain-containing protein [Crassisporium funariophilum]